MDLSQAMAAVKGQSLGTPKVRDICKAWNLCYYCKLSHPGFTAINCPNKGKKRSDLRAMDLYEPTESYLLSNPPAFETPVWENA